MTCTASNHGSAWNYQNGCRCPEAKQAVARFQSLRRAGLYQSRKRSAVGTARRLQALACMGYGLRDLAEKMGRDFADIGHLREGRPRFVSIQTYDEVSALFERLCMTPAPSKRGGATRAKKLAAGKGWQPPLAWDDIDNDPEPPRALSDVRWTNAERFDEIKVERTMVGSYRGELNTEERKEVVRRLHARGMNDMEIARRTGLVERTVLRNRLAMGLPAIPRWEAA